MMLNMRHRFLSKMDVEDWEDYIVLESGTGE